MNTAAVNAWKRKQKLSVNSASSRPKRQRRRRRRQISSEGDWAGVKADKTNNPENKYTNQSTSSRSTRSNLQGHNQIARSLTTQSPVFSTSSRPSLFVQLSPHSSFDRDLYIAYQSSLSTQGTLPSVLEHSDSGLGESFSEPDIPPPRTFEGIVPDSQSLPGSSSYIPTSPSGIIDYVDTTPISLASQQLSTSQQHTRLDSESTNHQFLQVEDSIDSSLLEIAATSLSSDTVRRSTSEPASGSAEISSSPPLRARFPSFSRCASDSTTSHHHDSRHHQRQRQQHRLQQGRVVCTSDSQFGHNLTVLRSQNSIPPTQAPTNQNKSFKLSSSNFKIQDLPDSLDSREPPPLPPSSDDKMSHESPDGGSTSSSRAPTVDEPGSDPVTPMLANSAAPDPNFKATAGDEASQVQFNKSPDYVDTNTGSSVLVTSETDWLEGKLRVQ